MAIKFLISRYLSTLILAMPLYGCLYNNRHHELTYTLKEYITDKDANIGVAVIINGVDTVAVNGQTRYPMLSVYKFPISVAMSQYYYKTGKSLDDTITIQPEFLHLNTHSPMTTELLVSGGASDITYRLPVKELMRYMLQYSDNNASDIILREIGGPESVAKFLDDSGISGMSVMNTENEMHIDSTLCYANYSTPIAMARFVDKFDRTYNDSISLCIKEMMQNCNTGTERLARPLKNTDAVIGHKTGTGFTLPDGRLMAVNDVGYVHLPDGHRYSIAVFIENSGYSLEATEALISDISEIVLDYTLK